jgi:hypothetical protein
MTTAQRVRRANANVLFSGFAVGPSRCAMRRFRKISYLGGIGGVFLEEATKLENILSRYAHWYAHDQHRQIDMRLAVHRSSSL